MPEPMEIIPVVDILGGMAVHAKLGHRAEYRPLESPLCASAAPLDVIRALGGRYRFKTLYVADLDALMGKRPQSDFIERLALAFPDLIFWVDRGWPESGRPRLANIVPVVGSESLSETDLDRLLELPPGWILSLDHKDQKFLGPAVLLDRPAVWPRRIILMNLSRVGSSHGPDLESARAFALCHPDHRFILGGGVRSDEDLRHIRETGVTAVLVASALHAGGLRHRQLDAYPVAGTGLESAP